MGAFSPEEQRKSSTWRECKVVHEHYLSKDAERFKDSTIYHYSDNISVTRVFKVGILVPEL